METLIDYQKALSMAEALLLKNGSVSIKEIKALSQIDRDFDASIISNALSNSFNVQIVNKKISSFPYMEWDSIITLNK